MQVARFDTQTAHVIRNGCDEPIQYDDCPPNPSFLLNLTDVTTILLCNDLSASLQ